MACEDLVAACFVDEHNPLTVPDLNRERALAYLQCCYEQGLSWEDAERQIARFLRERGVPPEGILRQVKRARPLFQPWLD